MVALKHCTFNIFAGNLIRFIFLLRLLLAQALKTVPFLTGANVLLPQIEVKPDKKRTSPIQYISQPHSTCRLHFLGNVFCELTQAGGSTGEKYLALTGLANSTSMGGEVLR